MNRNPVLNSPDDITDELIRQIIHNDLDSLTINYEFTKHKIKEMNWKDDNEEQIRINPFRRANKITPIKRLEFEIRLGKNVHSLARAFIEFEELEYVNIQDTSHVTDMSCCLKKLNHSINQSAAGILQRLLTWLVCFMEPVRSISQSATGTLQKLLAWMVCLKKPHHSISQSEAGIPQELLICPGCFFRPGHSISLSATGTPHRLLT